MEMQLRIPCLFDGKPRFMFLSLFCAPYIFLLYFIERSSRSALVTCTPSVVTAREHMLRCW